MFFTEIRLSGGISRLVWVGVTLAHCLPSHVDAPPAVPALCTLQHLILPHTNNYALI